MPIHAWCSLFEQEGTQNSGAPAQGNALVVIAPSEIALPLNQKARNANGNESTSEAGSPRVAEEDTEAEKLDTKSPASPAKPSPSLNDLLSEPIEFVNATRATCSAAFPYEPINFIEPSPSKSAIHGVPLHSFAPVPSTSNAQPNPSLETSRVTAISRALTYQWPSVCRGPAPGLVNTGNSCFMNAALQALIHTPPLLNALLRGEHAVEICMQQTERFCALCALANLAREAFVNRKRGSIMPSDFCRNLKKIAKHFSFGRQEDSHEFLRFAIDAMMMSELVGLGPCVITRPRRRPNISFICSKDADRERQNTLIQRVFGGRFRSRVQCLSCKHPSDTYESFLDLSLDIARRQNVDDALKGYRQTDRLSGKNQYWCEKCKRQVDAEKTVVVDQAPAVLTLHLKRFLNSGRKITGQVNYRTSVDISPIMADRTQEYRYELFAVVCHAGSGPHSGHYYAHVKAADDRWYRMDDTDVERTSSPPLNAKSAYMLFYARQAADILQAAVATAGALVTNGLTSASTSSPLKRKLDDGTSAMSSSSPLMAKRANQAYVSPVTSNTVALPSLPFASVYHRQSQIYPSTSSSVADLPSDAGPAVARTRSSSGVVASNFYESSDDYASTKPPWSTVGNRKFGSTKVNSPAIAGGGGPRSASKTDASLFQTQSRDRPSYPSATSRYRMTGMTNAMKSRQVSVGNQR